MKRAAVYRRKNAWIMHADSQTTVEAWIATAPRIRLHPEASPEEIGNALKLVIDGSKHSIPHPTDWSGSFRETLDLAGVRSWSEFSRGTACICVELDAGRMRFCPYENKGSREGYIRLPHKDFSIPSDSSAEAIGRAVQQAIELCE
jgi:hypothetical protein